MRNSNNAITRRCFGYVRASTLSQDDSLEMQRERIEGIARAEGLELVAVFADAATSGSVPLAHREQGKALFEVVGPGDVIIGLKLDRLFRDAGDAVETLKLLRKRKVGLVLRDLGLGDLTGSNVSGLIFGLWRLLPILNGRVLRSVSGKQSLTREPKGASWEGAFLLATSQGSGLRMALYGRIWSP